MTAKRLEQFGGWQKAGELFDLVLADVEPLAGHAVCGRLVSQQIAAADSVCANIEEGYGHGSRKEFIQFLRIARGSAREVYGRYWRMRRWIAPDLVGMRRALCDEVIGILTATIQTLRKA